MKGNPFQITLVPADAKTVNPSDAHKRVFVLTLLPSGVSTDLIVGGFFNDLNVVWMTLD
jgi:hypothetical protein